METNIKNLTIFNSRIANFANQKLVTIFLILIVNSLSHSQAGSLDLNFGEKGKVTTNFEYGSDPAWSVAFQSDGKIVVAGTIFEYSGGAAHIALMRYNIDGSQDKTFGSDGLSIENTLYISGANSVKIQKDDKIVVVGYANNSGIGGDNDFTLVRYNSDGSLDNTFDYDGIVTTDFGSHTDFCFSVDFQSDGKIIAVGESNFDNNIDGTDLAIVRYNNNGSLDNSFGSKGIVLQNFGSHYGGGRSVDIQSDGKIVVVGTTIVAGSSGDFVLVRYNSNGSLDYTFDSDGKVTTDFENGSDEQAYSAAIQSDGKIVVTGVINRTNPSSSFAIARYSSNGSLDNTFDTDGKITTDFGKEFNIGRSVAIQRNGKIVVAGTTGNSGSIYFALLRYNSDGSLDYTFDGDGKVTTDFGNLSSESYSLAIQSDGKMVLVGRSNINFAMARYNGDDPLSIEENSFTNNTIKVYPNPASNKITLHFNTQYPENAVIKITDMMGKIVYSHPYHIENDNLEMNVAGLTTGIYLLNIQSSEFSSTKKLIVTK